MRVAMRAIRSKEAKERRMRALAKGCGAVYVFVFLAIRSDPDDWD